MEREGRVHVNKYQTPYMFALLGCMAIKIKERSKEGESHY